MNLTKEHVAGGAIIALALATFACVAMFPALPIDETRYLTVAWEMRTQGNWSLPTLNFAPYAHKPPLLFWLINGSWSLFGLGVWQARLVGASAMAATLVLTHLLERRLVPATSDRMPYGALMLLGLPLFVTLGVSIMFDMLLTATVAGAMLALWIAGREGSARAFAAYGICVGLGLLAKGPVVFLFTLPPAVLAHLWIEPSQRVGWAKNVALAQGLAIGIGLAWALRASWLGGAEYAEMIFWKQSAGRMASSFAHARPFWFYIPVVLGFFAPLLLWQTTLDAISKRFSATDPARNFLLVWIIPALLGLSAISGKQIHYLLPLAPACVLLIAIELRRTPQQSESALPFLILAGITFVTLALLAAGGAHLFPDESVFVEAASRLSLPVLALTGLVVMAAFAIFARKTRTVPMALAISNLALLTFIAAQTRGTIAEFYDLQPIATAINRSGAQTIAVSQRTRGELGFLARLQQPLVYVEEEDLPCWLARTPRGLALTRDHVEDVDFNQGLKSADIVHQQRYRDEEVLSLVRAGTTPPVCTNAAAAIPAPNAVDPSSKM